MRFDLLGFSLSRKEYPKGVFGAKFFNWYLNLLHLQISRKTDPLNPLRRNNWSLLLLGHQDGFYHFEVLFCELRNDKKRVAKKMFMEQLIKSGQVKPRKFSDRIKAMGKW